MPPYRISANSFEVMGFDPELKRIDYDKREYHLWGGDEEVLPTRDDFQNAYSQASHISSARVAEVPSRILLQELVGRQVRVRPFASSHSNIVTRYDWKTLWEAPIRPEADKLKVPRRYLRGFMGSIARRLTF